MRIGVDGRELAGEPTGVGRYLRHLCYEWTRMPAASDCEVVLYTPGPIDTSTLLPPDARGATIAARVVPGTPGTWWEQWALVRAAQADDLDVFFGPGYSVPLRVTVPSVVTIHDISFVAHPEWFRWREGARRRWLARRSAAVAHTVLTVSEFCRGELRRYFDLDPARVTVVPNGIALPGPVDHHRPRDPLVLYVGAWFNRRHLPTLIAAFARLVRSRPDARLLIIGPDRTYPPQDLPALLAAAQLTERVTLRPYVDDAELASTYGRASVFAFLSEYEGFGMTPLEALAAGVPAVVGDTPVAHEVYRDAVRYVPVDDADQVATALAETMSDRTARDALLTAGTERLRELTWSRAATDTLAALRVAGSAGS